MLKRLSITALILVVVFAIVVAFQPAHYHVERSIEIASPALAVFEHVNDLRKWEAWSPWAKLDPNARFTYEGPPSGEGALFAWVGNDKIGAGRMQIQESRAGSFIHLATMFTHPFEGKSSSEFAFRPQNNATLVTWTVRGENGFIARAICLFVDIDEVTGSDLEKGLVQLKTIVEASGSTKN